MSDLVGVFPVSVDTASVVLVTLCSRLGALYAFVTIASKVDSL